jgi:hypothetical protein
LSHLEVESAMTCFYKKITIFAKKKKMNEAKNAKSKKAGSFLNPVEVFLNSFSANAIIP